MIIFHSIWTNTKLHLWSERASGETEGSDHGESRATGATPSHHPLALDHEELRRRAGDLWDTLLISGAANSHLTLRLPSDGQMPQLSTEKPTVDERGRLSLQPFEIPTLALSPTDSIDLLTGSSSTVDDDVRLGSSFRFWSRTAELALELLANQAFVPAAHDAGDGRYRGYWRVVMTEEVASERLRALIVSMPPVCRSIPSKSEEPVQASALIESFLWITVDALVRRCLEGDELAHAIHDRARGGDSLQMRWLRSLVHSDPALRGTADECSAVCTIVRDWISKLEPAGAERSCRTCFQLHAPADDGDAAEPSGAGVNDSDGVWNLTLHVQAISNRSLIVDAVDLPGNQEETPVILPRPFENALAQLRVDVGKAARHFLPLAACAEPDGPLACELTLAEAYSFLRDAAPILKLEGFGVWPPRWWREDGPRPRMWLDVRPTADQSVPGEATMRLDAVVAYDWRVAVGDDDLSLEEITRLAAAKEPLVRVRGRWTEVQPADMETALSYMTKNRSGTMTLFQTLRQCYAADDLDTGLPVAGLRAHGWIDTLLNATDVNAHIEELDVPKKFVGQLRPYQLRGLQWLSFLSKLGLGACLADDMGLGKTIQLIALWLHEREGEDSPGPTLLVVPMSLVGNWQREIERFAPSLAVMVHHGLDRLSGRQFVEEVAKHDVVISTYALTHRDRAHLADVDWHRIALDEAQNIKNPAAKQSVAIRSLRAVHRAALTGTPVENRLSELWSIMDFLNQGYVGSAAEFRRRFAVPIERYHDTDRASRLRQLIRPFILRRLKSDPSILVDLPAKLEMKVFCNLTREQAALYEAIVGEMLGHIDGSDGIQRRGLILATLVKLKQVCNHPAQFLADGSELPKRSGKCERLREMMDEVIAEGDRALVFTQYRQMGLLLKKLLESAFGRTVLFLHGGNTRQARDSMVEKFQSGDDDVPIFILSLKAGGFGLNLTAANHVFHFDRWWNPAVEDQATDRAHRIGQDRQVQVHKFVCVGTLEERIDALLERKRNLADNIIGTGESWLTELSTDALRDLFTLSKDAVAED